MNTKILQKVLDELNKENVDVSYIRGMVEALLSTTETPHDMSTKLTLPYINPKIGTEIRDESDALDAMAKAKLGTVQKLSEESMK